MLQHAAIHGEIPWSIPPFIQLILQTQVGLTYFHMTSQGTHHMPLDPHCSVFCGQDIDDGSGSSGMTMIRVGSIPGTIRARSS